ncbi:MAG: hypothetical protein LBP92_14675 [Deltaproteobacteria bacterium]|nr:hypothetical protein [Deltaproteobacteria bacterium]
MLTRQGTEDQHRVQRAGGATRAPWGLAKLGEGPAFLAARGRGRAVLALGSASRDVRGDFLSGLSASGAAWPRADFVAAGQSWAAKTEEPLPARARKDGRLWAGAEMSAFGGDGGYLV